MKPHFLLILFLFSVSCIKQDDYPFELPAKNVTQYEEKVRLEPLQSLEFEVDSLFSVDFIHSIVPFKAEGKDHIAILHERDIYIYELSNRQIKKKITIQKEGPNAVKAIESYDGIAMQSLEDFYLVSNTGGIIYHINDQGSVLEKIATPIDPAKGDTYDYSFIRAEIIDNRLFIPTYAFGNTADFTKVATRLVYDLQQKKFQSAFNYPNVYNQFYWGNNSLLRLNACSYNSDQQRYYISYPVDARVYVYDRNFALKDKKILGSKYFSTLYPQEEDGSKRFANLPANDEYFIQLSYFAGGYYHRDLDYYLRIARIGRDKEKNLGVRFSIIIADRNLDKIGEYLIPSYYVLESFFLEKQGIALLNLNKYDNTAENVITFDVLSVKRN